MELREHMCSLYRHDIMSRRVQKRLEDPEEVCEPISGKLVNKIKL
jgi:hypothetical protein